MSVKIIYTGTTAKFIKAVEEANKMMASEDFFNLISSRKEPFDESSPKDLSPSVISQLFRISNLTLTLKEYQKHPTVGGAFDPNYPNNLYGNINALSNREVCEFAGVFVHECVHALSYHSREYDFSHDGQRPQYNQDTAPYWIGNRVSDMLCGRMVTGNERLIVLTSIEANIPETQAI